MRNLDKAVGLKVTKLSAYSIFGFVISTLTYETHGLVKNLLIQIRTRLTHDTLGDRD